jgi:hypothetical protein
MGSYTRAELEDGFAHYQTEVHKAGESGDWNRFADLFTEDATYVEHMYGDFAGREAIREWIVRTMTTEPGCWMPWFPPTWHVVDEERGRVICEIRNRMQDPGDGSVHEATNITILDYAGNHLFSREEDVYNPGRFVEMIAGWGRAGHANGGLPEGATAWLDAAVPGWRQG